MVFNILASIEKIWRCQIKCVEEIQYILSYTYFAQTDRQTVLLKFVRDDIYKRNMS